MDDFELDFQRKNPVVLKMMRPEIINFLAEPSTATVWNEKTHYMSTFIRSSLQTLSNSQNFSEVKEVSRRME